MQWYLRKEQAFVSAIWQSMLGVNTGISSLFGVSVIWFYEEKKPKRSTAFITFREERVEQDHIKVEDYKDGNG